MGFYLADEGVFLQMTVRQDSTHVDFVRFVRHSRRRSVKPSQVAETLTKKTGFTAYAEWLGKSQFYTAL